MAPVTYIVNGEILDAHGNVYDEDGNLIRKSPFAGSDGMQPATAGPTYVVGGRIVDAHGNDLGPASVPSSHAPPEPEKPETSSATSSPHGVAAPPSTPSGPPPGPVSESGSGVGMDIQGAATTELDATDGESAGNAETNGEAAPGSWEVLDPENLITSKVWDLLNARFDSAEAVEEASDDEILKIKGIGQPTLDKIRKVIGPLPAQDSD